MKEQRLSIASLGTSLTVGDVIFDGESVASLNRKGWRIVQISGLVKQERGPSPGDMDTFFALVLFEREVEEPG
jgi:hypothetical protein